MSLPAQRAKVLLWFAIGRKEWSNVLNYQITGAFSGSFDIQAAAASVDTYFKANYLTAMGLDCLWLGPDIQVNNNGVISDASVYANDNGGGAGNALPNEVSAIVRLQSAHGGATGRGRQYISGVDTSFISDGFIIPSGLVALNAIATKIKGSLSIQGQTWVPSIYSRTDVAFYAIQSAIAEINVGTQRRRRPRR